MCPDAENSHPLTATTALALAGGVFSVLNFQFSCGLTISVPSFGRYLFFLMEAALAGIMASFVKTFKVLNVNFMARLDVEVPSLLSLNLFSDFMSEGCHLAIPFCIYFNSHAFLRTNIVLPKCGLCRMIIKACILLPFPFCLGI